MREKKFHFSFSRGHSRDFSNLIGSSHGLDFPISAHGHGNPDASFCLFVFFFCFFFFSLVSVAMFKTGKCCYILKYMELEILCLGMVLHFGTVETECKKVKLMLNH